MTEEEIERVARAMCAALGIDPDATVNTGYHDCMTPREEIEAGPVSFGALWQEPRWRTYRHDAAMAIAAKSALSR